MIRIQHWTAAFACALLLAAPSGARAAADEAETPGPPPAPVVPLDRLFELPSGFEPKAAERRGGVGETGWRSRFAQARTELEASEANLRAAKQELADLADSSGGWGVAPPVPGMQVKSNEAPMSYELSQRIKKNEAARDEAKRRLLDLEVEANLAGVPEAWRH